MPGEMAEMFSEIGREEEYWERPCFLTPLDYYIRFPHPGNSSSCFYNEDEDSAEDYGAILSNWDDI